MDVKVLMESGCKEQVPSVLVVGTAVAFFYFLDLILRQVQLCQKEKAHTLIKWPEHSTLICSEQLNSNVKASINSSCTKVEIHPHDTSEIQRSWKLRNIILSWIHSMISGPIAVLCVIQHPTMIEDIIGTCSSLALALVCFSLGYFIHDSIHMLRHKLSAETMELLLHHTLIFVTYGIAVVTRAFVAYAIVSLFMELNSVFLHARQLANMCRVPKSSYGYRILSVANLGTFVTFRLVTTAWMARWLLANWLLVPLAMALLGSFGLFVITVMNCVLLLRLVRSDFCIRKDSAKDS